MSEAITPAISDRICQHMNEDHADALILYARLYAQITTATAAKMLAIDSRGMDLLVQTAEAETPARIEFDHQLSDAQDAHHTLIEMLKRARK